MKLAVVGTGYVGSVTGACFAEMGNTVVCVDTDEQKIAQFKKGKAPLHEKGLDDLIERNLRKQTLSFTTKLADVLNESQIVFIAVGTPPQEDGSADLSHVLGVAREIGMLMEQPLIIVDKSTVPVGTAEKVKRVIQEELNKRGKSIEFHVVSNPEFLAQGTAVEDFLEPSRIVVGADDETVLATMKELYEPFMHQKERFYAMDPTTAEMVKYASNCVLAAKISVNNDIANICSRVGADYDLVRRAMGADKRIGTEFMYAGPGFGGSCFPKDVRALIKIAKDYAYAAGMFLQALETNENQKHVLSNMTIRRFGEDLSGKVFAVWGLAFKAGTDDMRESSALSIIHDLLGRGAKVNAHDPEAMVTAKRPEYFGDNESIAYFDDKYQAVNGADALLVVTEWKDFRSADFTEVKKRLKTPVIIDGRLLYDPKKMRELGIEYHSIGRPSR